MNRWSMGVLAAMVLGGSQSWAQEPDTARVTGRPALRLGEALKVIVHAAELEGPFDAWRGDSLTLVMPRGLLPLALQDVERISARRRQPLLALGLGGLVGGVGSALSIWVSNSLNDLSDCGVQCPRERNQSRTIMINALLGAGLTLAYDTFKPGFKTVYRRPPPARSR
jgi:hypothetical protein